MSLKTWQPGSALAAIAIRKLGPALACIDTGKVQPPEQGGGVAEVQDQAAPAGPEQAVIDGQRRLMIVALEMVEGQMPGIVDGEEAGLGPVRLARLVPGDALPASALHLQHVRHGMDRPGVGRAARDRLAPESLGLLVGARLLQAEGQHALREPIAGGVHAQRRQHAPRPLAKGVLAAGEEIGLMGELERQDVSRVALQESVEAGEAAGRVAFGPGARCREMQPFALVRPGRPPPPRQ